MSGAAFSDVNQLLKEQGDGQVKSDKRVSLIIPQPKLMPAAQSGAHSLGPCNRLLTRVTNPHHQLLDDISTEAFWNRKQKTTNSHFTATVSHWGKRVEGVISEASQCCK